MREITKNDVDAYLAGEMQDPQMRMAIEAARKTDRLVQRWFDMASETYEEEIPEVFVKQAQILTERWLGTAPPSELAPQPLPVASPPAPAYRRRRAIAMALLGAMAAAVLLGFVIRHVASNPGNKVDPIGPIALGPSRVFDVKLLPVAGRGKPIRVARGPNELAAYTGAFVGDECTLEFQVHTPKTRAALYAIGHQVRLLKSVDHGKNDTISLECDVQLDEKAGYDVFVVVLVDGADDPLRLAEALHGFINAEEQDELARAVGRPEIQKLARQIFAAALTRAGYTAAAPEVLVVAEVVEVGK